MKVYNDKADGDPATYAPLLDALASYRAKKNFDVAKYVEAKIALINEYYLHAGLKAAVIGVSGGIDSAVVLALVAEASKRKGSPITKIVPLALPALNHSGATNQNHATDRASEVAKHFGIDLLVFPQLKEIANIISGELASLLALPATPWSDGQLVAYARTPILYNTASILTDNGLPALVVGTTNLSEGGYLGYVGKASDGMVDLQVISDVYKAEVFTLARYLNLPSSILDAIPSGDMYDGRADEEVFGATYDFVELYMEWLSDVHRDTDLSINPVFKASAENLESLHAYNRHKYLVGSPSVHLDLWDILIPDGWNHHKFIGGK